MRKLTITSILLITVLGIFVTRQFIHQSEAQDETVPRALRTAPDPGVIRENGTIESAFSIPIVSEVPGTTIILSLVRDGSVVRKGEVLIELDDSKLRGQLQEQQIKLMTAQADAAQAEKNLKLHELETEESLIAAQTALEIAE